VLIDAGGDARPSSQGVPAARHGLSRTGAAGRCDRSMCPGDIAPVCPLSSGRDGGYWWVVACARARLRGAWAIAGILEVAPACSSCRRRLLSADVLLVRPVRARGYVPTGSTRTRTRDADRRRHAYPLLRETRITSPYRTRGPCCGQRGVVRTCRPGFAAAIRLLWRRSPRSGIVALVWRGVRDREPIRSGCGADCGINRWSLLYARRAARAQRHVDVLARRSAA